MAQRSSIRTDIKRLLALIEQKDADAATSAFRKVTSSIDRGVGKSLVTKNRAARLKSRLNNRLRALAA